MSTNARKNRKKKKRNINNKGNNNTVNKLNVNKNTTITTKNNSHTAKKSSSMAVSGSKKSIASTKNTLMCKRIMNIVLFPVMILYMEILYHIATFGKISVDILHVIFVALGTGCVIKLITSLWSRKVNRIVAYITTSLITILFLSHYIFYAIFKTCLDYAVIDDGGANAITTFSNILMEDIAKNIVVFILFLLPITTLIVLDRKFKLLDKEEKKTTIYVAVAMVAAYLISIGALWLGGTGNGTAHSLYFKEWIKDASYNRLGVISSSVLNIKVMIFGNYEEEIDLENGSMEMPTIIIDKEETTTGNNESAGNGNEEETTKEPVKEPEFIEKPNALDIDFSSISSSNEDLKWLNQYMSAATPTNTNKYTGMFKDYNLILLCAESFSPLAVDKEVTPTLYKLVNTGFVFNNYYDAAFNGTTDGEYMVCTGLMPNGGGTGSFQNTIGNNMAMCFGNMFGKLGYETNAYHNHSYDYYKRHITHTNMGYTFKGLNGGLNVKPTWPESDLEMIELTMDEYMDAEKFHTYYMTVSGHLNYNLTSGNFIARKNKEYVTHLPYSEPVQAYIACNVELDKALECLIKNLEEKGIADKTVIALACDHYPYALKEEMIDMIGSEEEALEWFEIYKSNLIIWSASMKEPVYVDKVCAAIDILPTLANLFGLEYDSRLYAGRDILSSEPGLVIYSDKSFRTDYMIYNNSTGRKKMLKDVELPDGYFESVRSIVAARYRASGKILTTDYYSHIFK